MGPQEVISSRERIGFPGVGIFAQGLVERISTLRNKSKG